MIRVPLPGCLLHCWLFQRGIQQDLGIWLECRLGLPHPHCKPDPVVLASICGSSLDKAGMSLAAQSQLQRRVVTSLPFLEPQAAHAAAWWSTDQASLLRVIPGMLLWARSRVQIRETEVDPPTPAR